ncbi:hypothetical protein DNTS_014382, partial [Danionella cerebrum]
YLGQAKASVTLSCLDQLQRKLEVLQFLSQKRHEPKPKLLELQNQIDSWLKSQTNHNISVLVLTMNRSDGDLLAALRQVT